MSIFGHSMLRLILFLGLFSLSNLCADDSLENFFENRFDLQPPSEQEQLAVIHTIRTFFDRLKSRDVSEAYFLNTSPQFQSATSYENFRGFIQSLVDINLNQKLDKHNVYFLNNEKNKADFILLINGNKKGQRFYIEFYLENQEGVWKIMNIKIYEIYLSKT